MMIALVDPNDQDHISR